MPSPPYRILVVDDDPGVRQLLVDALGTREELYEVETAVDALDAGRRVEQFHPDLLVLDVVMPGMNGLEFCQCMREREELSDIKIIILTGASEGAKAETALVYGADLFLQKPQPIDVLLAHIEELLDSN